MNLIEDIELVLGALFASLFGQGGGVLYTPIQLWNGSDFHKAAPISLFFVLPTQRKQEKASESKVGILDYSAQKKRIDLLC